MNASEPQIIIRSYSGTDKADCLDAFTSNIPAYFLAKELEEFELWLDQYVSRPDSQDIYRYYVITADDRVLGCGGFAIDLNKKDARMVWGMIHRHAHRFGLGKKLLLYRIRAIRDLVPDCTIALDTTQHAAPFFEKMGFTTIKITNNFYGEGMDRYDMVTESRDII